MGDTLMLLRNRMLYLVEVSIMRRNIRLQHLSGTEGVVSFAVVAAFYVFGTIFGGVLSYIITRSDSSEIVASLETMIQNAIASEVSSPDPLRCLLDSFRWPLVAFSLGFYALGVVGIPLLSGARGFLFAFSVNSLVRVLGYRGAILACALLGVSGLLTIPVFLVIATWGFLTSKSRLTHGSQSDKRSAHRSDTMPQMLLLVIPLLFEAFFEWRFLPSILIGISKLL